MASQYDYRARDSQGRAFQGTILADSEAAAAAHVRSKGYFVTRVTETKPAQDVGVMLRKLRSCSAKDIAVFCRQFATMLEAGLPMLTCLSILAEQTENLKLKETAMDVYKSVQEGMSLSYALRQHQDVFPAIMINMVESGEVGGVMEDVMNRMAVHFEKEYRLREKIKSATIYPVIILLMATAVVAFVLTFVLPSFMPLFANMRAEIPWPTKFLLAVSEVLIQYWWLVVLLALGAGVGFVLLRRQETVRLYTDGAMLHLPVVGPLMKKIAIARFSRTLSTLMRGGVPILTAMEAVKKTTGNLKMTEVLSASQTSLKEGEDLSHRLALSPLFPTMVVQMVSVGEQSGEMDKMLEKVAEFYEAEVDDMVNRLGSLIEPILIGILGAIVGFIVIAIFMPLFDIITNFNKVM